jgi:uncharacterized membrane protein YagU involved in acid resistance
MNRERNLLADLTLGILAGVAATWVLDRATTMMYERQDEEATKREQEVMGGETAYGVAAEKAAGLAGRELSEKQRQRYGAAVHWALGAGAGALYGALRSRTSWARLGFGSLYGVLFWLLVDEGANTLLRLTPPPQEFPWESHARGLAGHLAYGVAAEAALQLGDAVT